MPSLLTLWKYRRPAWKYRRRLWAMRGAWRNRKPLLAVTGAGVGFLGIFAYWHARRQAG
jgi:hypothetical protein